MENNEERKLLDLRVESKAYAIASIKLYQHLTEYALKKEFNLSKQYLISSTRIGDFIRQDNNLEAYYSASSAKYWLELLYNGGYIDDDQANAMLEYCDPLVRILYVISHPEARKDKDTVRTQPAATQVSSSFLAGSSATVSGTNPFAQKGGTL